MIALRVSGEDTDSGTALTLSSCVSGSDIVAEGAFVVGGKVGELTVTARIVPTGLSEGRSRTRKCVALSSSLFETMQQWPQMALVNISLRTLLRKARHQMARHRRSGDDDDVGGKGDIG